MPAETSCFCRSRTWNCSRVTGRRTRTSISTGWAVLRGAANRGSTALGLGAALLTALVFLALLALSHAFLPEVLAAKPSYLLAGCFWPALGLLYAYRIGSQSF